MTTYVYQDTEVELTGREAKRQGKTGRGSKHTFTEILVEIRPVNDPNAWKRWVKKSELFEIFDKNQLNQ